MKKLFLILQIFVTIFCHSQDLLTVREVFDYDIGDEFQFNDILQQQHEANADRWKVIDKWYSTSNDTLSYLIACDNYAGTSESGFFFLKDTIKLIYTNLDSLIFSYDQIIDTNNTIVKSLEYCDRPINEITNSTGGFEPTIHMLKFGKGIGKVREFLQYGDANEVATVSYSLFYYKKNGISCGSPDLKTSINEIEQYTNSKIYPNPATEKIYIELMDNIYSYYNMSIFDISGKLLENINLTTPKTEFDVSYFEKSVYLIKLQSTDKTIFKKFIKE